MNNPFFTGSAASCLIACFCCILLAAPFADAGTVRVPGDYAHIQDALDAAMNGDLVLVAAGIYSGEGNRDLDFHGKSVMLRSESGPESTIIDCGFLSGGVTFHTGEDSRTSINGFTILNGSAGYGAGISLEGASPRITDCTISGCAAEHDGGGIDCRAGSDPLVFRCRVTGCEAGFGGGIACYRSDPRIEACIFEGNTAHSFGGGIYLYYSESAILSCVVSDNRASSGAGIRCSAYGSPSILNCTVVDNEADISGGGIHGSSASAIFRATASIIWGNSPDEIVDYSGNSLVNYCDVEGGWPGSGNIDADPLFIAPGDFHIGEGSPCAETGGDACALLDMDGELRPRGSFPDIGADERDDGGLEVLLDNFPAIIYPGTSYSIRALVRNTDMETESFDSVELKLSGPETLRLLFEPDEPVSLLPGEEIRLSRTLVLPGQSVRPGFYRFSLSVRKHNLIEAIDHRFVEIMSAHRDLIDDLLQARKGSHITGEIGAGYQAHNLVAHHEIPFEQRL